MVGRKSWTGLALASVNSMIVCVIGLQTSQIGFIPANLFCIVVYVLNIRKWMKEEALQPDARLNERRAHAAPASEQIIYNQ